MYVHRENLSFDYSKYFVNILSNLPFIKQKETRDMLRLPQKILAQLIFTALF